VVATIKMYIKKALKVIKKRIKKAFEQNYLQRYSKAIKLLKGLKIFLLKLSLLNILLDNAITRNKFKR
jgi:ABC-type transporter MlaC component